MKTRSYGRYTFNVGHGYNFSKQWHIDTKLRLFYANDWSGKDPDAINDGTENNNKNYSFNLTHNGRISMNRPLMRTLSYTLGGSFSQVNSKNTRIVPRFIGTFTHSYGRRDGLSRRALDDFELFGHRKYPE